jgi:hypothetical protein
LGSEIGVAEAVHPITNLLADLGDPVRQLAHDQVIVEGGRSDGGQLRSGRDRPRLTVRDESESDGPLGDRVGERAPGVDELVKLQVNSSKVRPHDGPVQLLADQRQVSELMQRRL